MSAPNSAVKVLPVAAHRVREAARPVCGACFGNMYPLVARPGAGSSRAVPLESVSPSYASEAYSREPERRLQSNRYMLAVCESGRRSLPAYVEDMFGGLFAPCHSKPLPLVKCQILYQRLNVNTTQDLFSKVYTTRNAGRHCMHDEPECLLPRT
jgi:hypothetical protein